MNIDNKIMIVTYIVAIATLIGTFANIYKKRWGFIIWIITNLFWIIYNIHINEIPQSFLYGINLITSVIGWIKWGKKNEE